MNILNLFKIKKINFLELKDEIETIIDQLKINCSISNFEKYLNSRPYYWRELIEKCKLSEKFIERFYNDKIDLYNRISYYQELSENFIRKHAKSLDWFHISAKQKLSENFVREFYDFVDWPRLLRRNKLSEAFIEEFKDEIGWYNISQFANLSEEFIKKYAGDLKWENVSAYQILSEDLIREFKNSINFTLISKNQKLSEKFIEEFGLKLSPSLISEYQKLSDDFIRKHSDKLDWLEISISQKLSEDLIIEFKDKVDWEIISKYQKLSEEFIKKHINFLNKNNIVLYQKLSRHFLSEVLGTGESFNYSKLNDTWMNKDTEFKKQQIIDINLYECHDDYFIAYKSIKMNRYSVYNFQYQYLKGETYESHADYTDNENSFGLSAWTSQDAASYYDRGLIVKCKIYYEDVARLVHKGNKIRCTKLTILD